MTESLDTLGPERRVLRQRLTEMDQRLRPMVTAAVAQGRPISDVVRWTGLDRETVERWTRRVHQDPGADTSSSDVRTGTH
ncbi:hypothetical protein [Embleya sp. NPDC005575]|uniref:hypothetical protein n=1 Tax=Embleya sp. NPDC005575 TaxID=3156892 RepID=UPI0033A685E2